MTEQPESIPWRNLLGMVLRRMQQTTGANTVVLSLDEIVDFPSGMTVLVREVGDTLRISLVTAKVAAQLEKEAPR